MQLIIHRSWLEECEFLIYLALGAIVLAHVATVVVNIADTRRIPCRWIWATGMHGKQSCELRDDGIAYLIVDTLTIVLDFVILFLPCPMAWRLNMPR